MTEFNKTKKTKSKRLAIMLGITILALAGLTYAMHVTPKSGYHKVELGDIISHDPSSYLDGFSFAVGLADVDLSQVEADNPGTYPVTVDYLFTSFPFQITIEDTTAPNLILKDGGVYLAANRIYDPSYFIEELTDNSKDVQTSFEGKTATVQYDSTGDVQITIVASDISGNETEATLLVTVENAPELLGIQDYYITPDATPDYLQDIYAVDLEDGDLSEQIIVDDSAVDTSMDGVYPLLYQVYDSHGIATTGEADVNVLSAVELEQRVENRGIDVLDNRVVGIPNFRDAGAAETPDVEREQEYILPTLVRLEILSERMRGNGSGFIINITDDYIDICSNEHVLRYNIESYTAVFHGGDRIDRIEKLGTNAEYDVGFARIWREDIPDEVFNTLRSIHLDETWWNAMSDDGRELLMVSLGTDGDAERVRSGKLIAKDTEAKPYLTPLVTEVELGMVPGTSGSPVVDAYGNLTGMVTGILGRGDGTYRKLCIRMIDIVEQYEEITGNTLYTY